MAYHPCFRHGFNSMSGSFHLQIPKRGNLLLLQQTKMENGINRATFRFDCSEIDCYQSEDSRLLACVCGYVDSSCTVHALNSG